MDLNDELENLALNAAYEQHDDEGYSSNDVSQGTIKMYQERYERTVERATELVEMTKTAKKPTSKQPTMLTPSQARTIYILQFSGPLNSPIKVKVAAGLSKIPEARLETEDWLNRQKKHRDFQPVFVSYGMAYKELSSTSLYPTLGKDATLPQNRPQDSHLVKKEVEFVPKSKEVPAWITAEHIHTYHAGYDFTPTEKLYQVEYCPLEGCLFSRLAPRLVEKDISFGANQNQYPVWFFFYGTLADVERRLEILGISEQPSATLHSARVYGGKMKTWGGKYNALVDGTPKDYVSGSAYKVLTKEHEDHLRKYETHNYEIVRCIISADFGEVQGLTFRFIGDVDK